MTPPLASSQISLAPTYHYRWHFPGGYTFGLEQPDRHASVEIMYVQEGACTFYYAEQSATVGKGSYIYLPAYCPHGHAVPEGGCQLMNIEFLPVAAGGLGVPPALVTKEAPFRHLLTRHADAYLGTDEELVIASAMERILDEMAGRRWGQDTLVPCLLWELLTRIARQWHTSHQHECESPQITRAKEFLAQHMHRPVTMAMVARHVGVSRTYFQRIFIREVGMTPKAFLNQLRLQHAQALLTRTDLSIAHIAQRIGLGHPQFLHLLFQRHFAMTPGEYRRQMRATALIAPAVKASPESATSNREV